MKQQKRNIIHGSAEDIIKKLRDDKILTNADTNEGSIIYINGDKKDQNNKIDVEAYIGKKNTPKDPTKPGGGNPDPEKYWSVKFESADPTKGTIVGANTVYVLKTDNKTLADIVLPPYISFTGNQFNGWNLPIDTAINKDLIVKALFITLSCPPLVEPLGQQT